MASGTPVCCKGVPLDGRPLDWHAWACACGSLLHGSAPWAMPQPMWRTIVDLWWTMLGAVPNVGPLCPLWLAPIGWHVAPPPCPPRRRALLLCQRATRQGGNQLQVCMVPRLGVAEFQMAGMVQLLLGQAHGWCASVPTQRLRKSGSPCSGRQMDGPHQLSLQALPMGHHVDDHVNVGDHH